MSLCYVLNIKLFQLYVYCVLFVCILLRIVQSINNTIHSPHLATKPPLPLSRLAVSPVSLPGTVPRPHAAAALQKVLCVMTVPADLSITHLRLAMHIHSCRSGLGWIILVAPILKSQHLHV